MLGYRLLRESDYDRLIAQIDAAHATIAALQQVRAELLIAVGDAKASERSKATAVDHLVVAVNETKLEAGQLRAKLTGLPVQVPQIGVGTPLSADGIGAGVDLFEDPGDERAESLRQKGLLHDDGDMSFPEAAALAPLA